MTALSRWRHLLRLSTAALLLHAAATGCARPDREGAFFHGVALDAPLPKPSFTLTDFNGKPFDFARETRDKVALLFFGYTHCPDVCPLHMVNLAAVLKQMPWEERAYVKVVFVTTDPARDTPPRLKEWLGNFDPTFIGLTGSESEVARVQASMALRQAEREYGDADSTKYLVGHAAQVFAFGRDGYAYLVYPADIRQEDWANDLPRLARDSSGIGTRRALAAARGRSR